MTLTNQQAKFLQNLTDKCDTELLKMNEVIKDARQNGFNSTPIWVEWSMIFSAINENTKHTGFLSMIDETIANQCFKLHFKPVEPITVKNFLNYNMFEQPSKMSIELLTNKLD